MCKVLVKIKSGQGSFFDINSKEAKPVLPHRPYVVKKTAAVDMAVSSGLLTILRDSLPDYTTDEIWSKFYHSSKTEVSAINKLMKYKPSQTEEAPEGDENPEGNETPDGDENPDEGDENPEGNENPEGDENPEGNETPDGDEPKDSNPQ